MRSSFSKVALALAAMSIAATAADDLTILSRKDWNAKPPSLAMTQHTPRAILIHHTGSPQKLKRTLAAKMQGLQRFSQSEEKLADGRKKPAWPDVPYHFYIAVDGQIAEGRDINAVGDTNTAYNPKGYIQVVLEGDFDKEQVTPAQKTALTSLLASLKKQNNIDTKSILSHANKAQTVCPGKHLSELLPKILALLDGVK